MKHEEKKRALLIIWGMNGCGWKNSNYFIRASFELYAKITTLRK